MVTFLDVLPGCVQKVQVIFSCRRKGQRDVAFDLQKVSKDCDSDGQRELHLDKVCV